LWAKDFRSSPNPNARSKGIRLVEGKRGTEKKFSLVTVTVKHYIKSRRDSNIFSAVFWDRLNGSMLTIRQNSIWYRACVLVAFG